MDWFLHYRDLRHERVNLKKNIWQKKNVLGTFKSVPQFSRSGNLDGTKTIITAKFQGLNPKYFTEKMVF